MKNHSCYRSLIGKNGARYSSFVYLFLLVAMEMKGWVWLFFAFPYMPSPARGKSGCFTMKDKIFKWVVWIYVGLTISLPFMVMSGFKLSSP